MATPEQAARDLELLGRRLKTADKTIRRDMLREIRQAGKPTVEDIKRSARESLPASGGLADLVARQSYGVRTRLAGKSAGVRIQGTGRTVRGLRSIDAGAVRHPVFGNKDAAWVSQSVRSGFFTEPIEDDLPRFRKAVTDALEKTAAEIVRGV